MNNSFGAMYAAILFLGATNAATVQPLSPLSVLFSTVKKLLECGRGNYVQHGTTGVYALIIYSMIGYDWTVAKFLWFYYSMLTSFTFHAIRYDDCGLDTKLSDQWDLHSLESLFRFTQTKTDGTTGHTPVAWTLYCIITSQVGDKDSIVQIAGVGDMSLKTLLKYGFGFEHDFLPVVAAVRYYYSLSLTMSLLMISTSSTFKRTNSRFKPIINSNKNHVHQTYVFLILQRFDHNHLLNYCMRNNIA
ncbi:hypothetical protein YC2023_075349 [Brassica napus]